MRELVLVGNPNSGKSTFFNRLTGARQKVGNWPGVTVEKKAGVMLYEGQSFSVIDLPGLYSLAGAGLKEAGIDEKISFEYLKQLSESSYVVNVIDATNLERSLYLTSQLLAWQLPMIIVLTKLDLAKKQGLMIDIAKLSESLGVPVLSNKDEEAVNVFKNQIAYHVPQKSSVLPEFPIALQQLKSLLMSHLANREIPSIRYAAMLIESHSLTALSRIIPIDAALKATLPEDLPLEVAASAYQFAHETTKKVLKRRASMHRSLTRYLDKLFLNRALGLPLFFTIMYMMFFFSINVGGAFQDAFSGLSHLIFVETPAFYAHKWGLPNMVSVLIAGGIGQGLSTTITFIPIIFALFFFLSFLEGSGYIARAAFLMDKGMQFLGLPGKAFVPMLLGFGCNVPAILGTRTLKGERDRILTILMVPFMSCSARLAIFSVFVGAFFQEGGALIVFSLYVIGIAVAVLTGFLLKKSLVQGKHSPLILELPNYEWPKFSYLWQDAAHRVTLFLKRGVRVIVPACMLLSFLNSSTLSGGVSYSGETSILAYLGKSLTPLLSPLGISQDNWPATVALMTGAVAKEVVIGTLNTLYSSSESLAFFSHGTLDFFIKAKLALISVPGNLALLGHAFFSPLSSAAKAPIDANLYGALATRFASPTVAYAYLLFTLLYVPCISTLAVIKKELNTFWMMFSLFWSTLLAYGLAAGFYLMSKAHFSWWIISKSTLVAILFYTVLIYSLKYLFSHKARVGTC